MRIFIVRTRYVRNNWPVGWRFCQISVVYNNGCRPTFYVIRLWLEGNRRAWKAGTLEILGHDLWWRLFSNEIKIKPYHCAMNPWAPGKFIKLTYDTSPMKIPGSLERAAALALVLLAICFYYNCFDCLALVGSKRVKLKQTSHSLWEGTIENTRSHSYFYPNKVIP